jgi:hypothetical protein
MLEDYGLRESLKAGRPVTLVLGAGVSRDRGLPLWGDLLRAVWRRVFPAAFDDRDKDFLLSAKQACRQANLPEDLIKRLDVSRHPFEMQFAFELVYDRIRRGLPDPAFCKRLGLPKTVGRSYAAKGSNEQAIADAFSYLLRTCLYQKKRRPKVKEGDPDTLSLIVGAVRRNAKLPAQARLIDQVITFNVDDLLEREVNEGCRRRMLYAVPIARASAVRPLTGPRSIAIYHLHGFVPMASSRYAHLMEDSSIENVKAPSESLVFTDEQYWRTVGNPTGFASRLFVNALAGRCVFIGLSMTDVNIVRWLAQDSIERRDDFRRLTREWDTQEADFNESEQLSRHYWITEKRPDHAPGQRSFPRNDVLRNTLRRRGVISIDIPCWHSDDFHKWWRACFLS